MVGKERSLVSVICCLNLSTGVRPLKSGLLICPNVRNTEADGFVSVNGGQVKCASLRAERLMYNPANSYWGKFNVALMLFIRGKL